MATRTPTTGTTKRIRLASFATYAAGPVAIVLVVWLHARGLIADTPLWLLAAVILATGLVNFTASAWLAQCPESATRLQARIGLGMLCTAAVTYSAGWGPLVIVGYLLVAAELLRTVGPHSLRYSMAWMWVAIASGEIAVQAGVAPSMVSPALSHVVALVGALCASVVVDVLARTGFAQQLAEQRLEERSRHFEELVANAEDVIGVVGADGTIESISPAVTTFLGRTVEEVRGRQVERFLAPWSSRGVRAVLAEVLTHRGRPVRMEIGLLHSDGSERTVLVTLSSPSADWGDRIIVNLHDVTHQRALEDQLRHDARHDPLTGLLNRAAFAEATARACRRATRNGTLAGMLYIDLDGFKEVNDTYGHEIGDRVLVQVGRRLEDEVRSDAVLARLGGDEFAVVMDAVGSVDELTVLADRLLDAISAPLDGLPDEVRVGGSIGIAVRSDEGIEMSAFIRRADEAMYAAKRNGRSRWELAPL